MRGPFSTKPQRSPFNHGLVETPNPTPHTRNPICFARLLTKSRLKGLCQKTGLLWRGPAEFFGGLGLGICGVPGFRFRLELSVDLLVSRRDCVFGFSDLGLVSGIGSVIFRGPYGTWDVEFLETLRVQNLG